MTAVIVALATETKRPRPIVDRRRAGQPLPLPWRSAPDLAQAIEEGAADAVVTPELAFVPAIGFLAAATQGVFHLDISARQNQMLTSSIYAVAVAEPAVGKTRVWQGFEKPFRDAENAGRATYAAREAVWQADLAVLKTEYTDAVKTRDQVPAQAAALAIAEHEKTRPLQPERMLETVTLEGLYDHAEAAHPSVVIASDDAAKVLLGYSSSTEKRTEFQSALASLYSGSPVRKKVKGTTGGSRVQFLPNRRLTIVGMVQPKPFEKVREMFDGEGVGLSTRFLYVPTDSASIFLMQAKAEAAEAERLEAGRKPAAGRGATMAEYARRVGTILGTPVPTTRENGVETRPMRIDHDALIAVRRHSQEVKDRMAALLASGGDGGDAGTLPRSTEIGLRIAQSLATWVWAGDPTGDVPVITLAIIEDALDMADWFADQSGGTPAASDALRIAQKISDWLFGRRAKASAVITVSWLLNNCPDRNRLKADPKLFDDVMVALVRTGHLIAIAGNCGYTLNPLDPAAS